MLKKASSIFSNVYKDRAFSDFQKRLGSVLNNPGKRTYVLELNRGQLRQLYEGVLPYIETSIYAEMEYVMVAIRTAYDVVIQRLVEEMQTNLREKETEKNAINKQKSGVRLGNSKSFSLNKELDDTEESETIDESSEDQELQDIVKSRIKTFMGNEKSFQRFIAHIQSNYQSLQKQRINILMVKHDVYQSFELRLFDENYMAANGFKAAYDLHNQLMKAFDTTFDDLLFAGQILDTDGKINKQVLDVVLKKFQSKLESGSSI